MICPACNSVDTRPSRKETRLAFLQEWRGRHLYRCRECRHKFYVQLSSQEMRRLKEAENLRMKRKRGWKGLIQKRTHRRAVEVLVFFGMLAVFYLAFNSLVSRDGAGLLHHAGTEAQP
jgi:hypothetical protein